MAKQQLSRRQQRKQSRSNNRNNKNQNKSQKRQQRRTRKNQQRRRMRGGERKFIKENQIPPDYDRILCVYYKDGDLSKATITNHEIVKTEDNKYKFPENEGTVKRVNIDGEEDMKEVNALKKVFDDVKESEPASSSSSSSSSSASPSEAASNLAPQVEPTAEQSTKAPTVGSLEEEV